jgi:hypothetical protein
MPMPDAGHRFMLPATLLGSAMCQEVQQNPRNLSLNTREKPEAFRLASTDGLKLTGFGQCSPRGSSPPASVRDWTHRYHPISVRGVPPDVEWGCG